MTTSTFTVSGMTCEHCVRAVTEEVSAIDGVEQVRVHLETGELTIDSTGPVDEALVKAAVDEAGYALAAGPG